MLSVVAKISPVGPDPNLAKRFWGTNLIRIAALALCFLLVNNILNGEYLLAGVNLLRGVALASVYYLLFIRNPFRHRQLPFLLLMMVFNTINTIVAVHRASGVEYLILSNLVWGLLFFKFSRWAIVSTFYSLCCFSLVQFLRADYAVINLTTWRVVANVAFWVLFLFFIVYDFLKHTQTQIQESNGRIAAIREELEQQAKKLQRQSAQMAQMQNDTAQSIYLNKKTMRSMEQIAEQVEELEHPDSKKIANRINRYLKDDTIDIQILVQQCRHTHPSFVLACEALVPALTPSQFQLLVLHKLQLPAQEICMYLSVSEGGLQKARTRLRKRYAWTNRESLYTITTGLG